jgi:hypothetical protein
MLSKHTVKLQNHIHVKLTAQYNKSDVTEPIMLPSNNDYVVDQLITTAKA